MKLISRVILRYPLFFMILFFSLPSLSADCQFDFAVNAYESAEYKNAIKLYKKCAKQGHVESNAALGNIYLEGLGTRKNVGKAIAYLERAAEENHIWAQKALFHTYRNEKSGESAQVEAANWALKLAENGDAEYMANMGDLFRKGEGVLQDYQQSKYWYEESIKNGHQNAYAGLGTLYAYGLGMDKDLDKGLEYSLLAANTGDSVSQAKVGMIYLKKMEHDPEAVHQAIKYFSLSADQGFGKALHQLFGIYYFGKGVDKDYKKAFQLAKRGAYQKLSWAYTSMGSIYYSGRGLETDPIKAYAWFKISYEQGDKESKSIMKEIGLHRVHIKEANRIADELKREIFGDT